MVVKPVHVAALLTAVLVYSGIAPVYRTPVVQSVLSEDSITQVRGVIVSSPVRTSSGNSYRMSVSVSAVEGPDFYGNPVTSDSSGTITLFVDAPLVEALYPGRLYSALGKRNAELLDEGVHISAAVRYFSSDGGAGYYSSEVTSSGFSSPVSRIRCLMRLQLKRLLYTWGEAGGLLLALLSGEREYTEQKLAENFRLAGISHILALSGMHLSLFSSLAQKATRNRWGIRLSETFGLLAAFLFVWFAGSTPSLVRSLLCMAIGFFCRRLFIKSAPLETLCLAFLIQVAFFPEQAGELAFKLSYLALLGVFMGSAFFSPVFQRILPPPVAESIGASTGSCICTCLISLVTFGSVMPFGILAAAIVTPLAEWFVTAGICGILITLIVPFLLVPVGGILSIPYTVLHFLVQSFSRLPGISVSEDL